MIPLLLAIVGAVVIGISPGLALIAVSVPVLAVDAMDPGLIDGMLRRATG